MRKFSETDMWGDEDLFEILFMRDGDIELAQYGSYNDEIDKIASSNNSIGPMLENRFNGLLKPMEETEVDLCPP
jgi:hypothetical protein